MDDASWGPQASGNHWAVAHKVGRAGWRHGSTGLVCVLCSGFLCNDMGSAAGENMAPLSKSERSCLLPQREGHSWGAMRVKAQAGICADLKRGAHA